ncbi:MAG: phosphoribosylaminoimidazolesuccinocarboxamide synthase, partial [Actinobacteria bacterium]
MTLTKIYSGKVRDLYDVGDGTLILVASDRMSAFDVVMRESVPDKGRVLTAMSAFWFGHLGNLASNHLIGLDHPDAPPEWAGRMMHVRRAEMLPVEC